jgi:diguanylate cyclase (GGDEF)-like protein
VNRGRLRDRKLICAAILVCVVGVAVVSALTLSYLHRQAQARVASTTQNLARSLVQTFDGLLDAIDVALLASADEIAWQGASGEPDLARINAFLRTQQQRLPVMPYLRATNASGDVVHGDGLQPPYINLADRPSFISLRDQVVDGLYIGAPGPSRVNHLWAWPVSRRITNADGSFGGMVYAALTVGQIGRLMDRIKLNDGASITLRNAGFEAVAARVGAGGGRRPALGDTRLSPELQAALARDRRSGTYVTSASVLASTAQTFSYERSEKYGFYVWVGEDNDVAMAGWQRQSQLICGLAVAFGLLAVGLLLLLGRVWRRQERDVGAIERLAYYDALTGLPNRRLMHDRLVAAMGHAGVHALMLIDLDHFKNLNDVQGHARGDQLLQAVAGRLVGQVRRDDTVARMGGDEFALLLLGMGENEEQARMRAAAFGETVRHALCQRFDLDGHQYASTPSVGITLFCGAQFSADELTKRADTAMYQVKANGRNGVRFFDPAMQAALTARLALEQDLQRAVQARQLVLHFQPQVDANGCVTGAEVLLRWHHPQRGMVAPGEFIAMAETSGAILEIGHWVLETACAQLAAWAHDNARAT